MAGQNYGLVFRVGSAALSSLSRGASNIRTITRELSSFSTTANAELTKLGKTASDIKFPTGANRARAAANAGSATMGFGWDLDQQKYRKPRENKNEATARYLGVNNEAFRRLAESGQLPQRSNLSRADSPQALATILTVKLDQALGNYFGPNGSASVNVRNWPNGPIGATGPTAAGPRPTPTNDPANSPSPVKKAASARAIAEPLQTITPVQTEVVAPKTPRQRGTTAPAVPPAPEQVVARPPVSIRDLGRQRFHAEHLSPNSAKFSTVDVNAAQAASKSLDALRVNLRKIKGEASDSAHQSRFESVLSDPRNQGHLENIGKAFPGVGGAENLTKLLRAMNEGTRGQMALDTAITTLTRAIEQQTIQERQNVEREYRVRQHSGRVPEEMKGRIADEDTKGAVTDVVSRYSGRSARAWGAYSMGAVSDRSNTYTNGKGTVSNSIFDFRENPRNARSFREATRRVINWGAGASVIYGGFEQLKGGIKTMSEFERAIVSVRKASNPLGFDIDRIGESAKSLGKEFGASIVDVATGFNTFAEQGKTTKEVIESTRSALMLSNVTMMSLNDSIEAITSSEKQFNIASSDSMKIVDSLNEVAKETSVGANHLADGVKRAGAAMKAAGVDFNQTLGIVAAIGETTRKSGDDIGTSMKYIFQHIRDDKAVESLQNIGIFTENANGKMKSSSAIVSELSRKWSTLTDAQKQNIGESVASTEHINDFFVLMNNWDRAIDLSVASMNSQGSAMRDNRVIMETLDKQVGQLKASYESLWASVGKSGVLSVIKNLVDATRNLLDMFGKLNNGLGGLPAAGLAAYAGTRGVLATGSYLASEVVAPGLFGKMEMTGKPSREDMARQALRNATRGRLIGEDMGALAPEQDEGAGEPFINRRRKTGLGLVALGGVGQYLYDQYGKQSKIGEPLTGRDTSVNILTTLTEAAGSFMTLAKTTEKGKGFWASQGAMTPALIATVAAAAVQSYGQYNSYKQTTAPDSQTDVQKQMNSLKDYQEKLVNSRAGIQSLLQQSSTGQDIDVNQFQDLKDQMMLIAPEIAQVDGNSSDLVKTLKDWSAGIKNVEQQLRGQRTGIISAGLNRYEQSDDFKTAQQRVDAAQGKLNSAVKAGDPNAKFVALSELNEARAPLREGVQRLISQVTSAGQARQPMPFDDNAIDEKANAYRFDSERLRRDAFRGYFQGQGVDFSIDRQLDAAGMKSLRDVRYYQTDEKGPVFRRSDGKEANPNEVGNNFVLRSNNAQFGDAIPILKAKNLDRLMGEFEKAVEQLIKRNQSLIENMESVNASVANRTFGQAQYAGGPTAFGDIERQGQVLRDIFRDGFKELKPLNSQDPRQFQLSLVQMTGEIMRNGANGSGISPQGLFQVAGAARSFSTGIIEHLDREVQSLLENGGKPQGTDENGNPVQNVNQRALQALLSENVRSQVMFNADRYQTLQGSRATANPDQLASIDKEIATLRAQTSDLIAGDVKARPRKLEEDAANFAREIFGKVQQTSVGGIQQLGRQFLVERSINPNASINQFLGSNQTRGVRDTLRTLSEQIEPTRAALQQQLEGARERGDPAEIKRAEDALRMITEAAPVVTEAFQNLAEHVKAASLGIVEMQQRMGQTQTLAGGGRLFGQTGVAGEKFSMEFFRRQAEQATREADNLGPGQEDRKAQLKELARGYGEAALQNEQSIKNTNAARQQSMEGLPSSYLTNRALTMAGIQQPTAGLEFRQSLIDSITEQIQSAAKAFSADRPFDAKTGQDFQSKVGAQLQELSGFVRSAQLDTDPEYQRNYMLASPSSRAMADYVRTLQSQGSTTEEIFADPHMRAAASNEPLMGSLLQSGLERDMSMRSMDLARDQADKQGRMVGLLGQIRDIIDADLKNRGQQGYSGVDTGLINTTKQPATQPTSDPNAPKVSSRVGTMALKGTTAVDSMGRIKQDGTVAQLHEGEIVLNKKQSKEFLQNHFATGTLPPNIMSGSKLFSDIFSFGTNRGLLTTDQNGDPTGRVNVKKFASEFASLERITGYNEGLLGRLNTATRFGVGQHPTENYRAFARVRKPEAVSGRMFQERPEVRVGTLYSSDTDDMRRLGYEQLLSGTAQTGHEITHVVMDPYLGQTRKGATSARAVEARAGIQNQLFNYILSDTSAAGMLAKQRVLHSYKDILNVGTLDELYKSGQAHSLINEFFAHKNELGSHLSLDLGDQYRNINRTLLEGALPIIKMGVNKSVSPATYASRTEESLQTVRESLSKMGLSDKGSGLTRLDDLVHIFNGGAAVTPQDLLAMRDPTLGRRKGDLGIPTGWGTQSPTPTTPTVPTSTPTPEPAPTLTAQPRGMNLWERMMLRLEPSQNVPNVPLSRRLGRLTGRAGRPIADYIRNAPIEPLSADMLNRMNGPMRLPPGLSENNVPPEIWDALTGGKPTPRDYALQGVAQREFNAPTFDDQVVHWLENMPRRRTSSDTIERIRQDIEGNHQYAPFRSYADRNPQVAPNLTRMQRLMQRARMAPGQARDYWSLLQEDFNPRGKFGQVEAPLSLTGPGRLARTIGEGGRNFVTGLPGNIRSGYGWLQGGRQQTVTSGPEFDQVMREQFMHDFTPTAPNAPLARRLGRGLGGMLNMERPQIGPFKGLIGDRENHAGVLGFLGMVATPLAERFDAWRATKNGGKNDELFTNAAEWANTGLAGKFLWDELKNIKGGGFSPTGLALSAYQAAINPAIKYIGNQTLTNVNDRLLAPSANAVGTYGLTSMLASRGTSTGLNLTERGLAQVGLSRLTGASSALKKVGGKVLAPLAALDLVNTGFSVGESGLNMLGVTSEQTHHNFQEATTGVSRLLWSPISAVHSTYNAVTGNGFTTDRASYAADVAGRNVIADSTDFNFSLLHQDDSWTTSRPVMKTFSFLSNDVAQSIQDIASAKALGNEMVGRVVDAATFEQPLIFWDDIKERQEILSKISSRSSGGQTKDPMTRLLDMLPASVRGNLPDTSDPDFAYQVRAAGLRLELDQLSKRRDGFQDYIKKQGKDHSPESDKVLERLNAQIRQRQEALTEATKITTGFRAGGVKNLNNALQYAADMNTDNMRKGSTALQNEPQSWGSIIDTLSAVSGEDVQRMMTGGARNALQQVSDRFKLNINPGDWTEYAATMPKSATLLDLMNKIYGRDFANGADLATFLKSDQQKTAASGTDIKKMTYAAQKQQRDNAAAAADVNVTREAAMIQASGKQFDDVFKQFYTDKGMGTYEAMRQEILSSVGSILPKHAYKFSPDADPAKLQSLMADYAKQAAPVEEEYKSLQSLYEHLKSYPAALDKLMSQNPEVKKRFDPNGTGAVDWYGMAHITVPTPIDDVDNAMSSLRQWNIQAQQDIGKWQQNADAKAELNKAMQLAKDKTSVHTVNLRDELIRDSAGNITYGTDGQPKMRVYGKFDNQGPEYAGKSLADAQAFAAQANKNRKDMYKRSQVVEDTVVTNLRDRVVGNDRPFKSGADFWSAVPDDKLRDQAQTYLWLTEQINKTRLDGGKNPNADQSIALQKLMTQQQTLVNNSGLQKHVFDDITRLYQTNENKVASANGPTTVQRVQQANAAALARQQEEEEKKKANYAKASAQQFDPSKMGSYLYGTSAFAGTSLVDHDGSIAKDHIAQVHKGEKIYPEGVATGIDNMMAMFDKLKNASGGLDFSQPVDALSMDASNVMGYSPGEGTQKHEHSGELTVNHQGMIDYDHLTDMLVDKLQKNSGGAKIKTGDPIPNWFKK